MNTPFEKRICYTICICQLTAVLSCVSIVYLTVAVYSPSYKSLNSGFIETPVMCTTILNATIPNCEVDGAPSWSSCGEWCLSKSSGSCTQITVDVRNNGSNLILEDCQMMQVGSAENNISEPYHAKYCDGINPNMQTYACIEKDACTTLHGIFNCTKSTTSATGEVAGAVCRNLTSVLSCILTTTDDPIKCNTKKSCLGLDGLYDCVYGSCARVRPPYKCEKRCISINTTSKSIIVRQGDVVFTANCARARDAQTKEEIWPKDLKSIKSPDQPPILMMFCTNVMRMPEDKRALSLTDCFNGSLLEPGHFGNFSNITHIVQSHYDADRLLDPIGRSITPPEQDLLIYNNTPLYINFEACVNTLRGDCEKFHADYGSDGRDLRSQSRFQCYQNPNASEYVVLRFSRMKTMMELMIAAIVPVTLAIVSCFTLIICTRIIHVADDSHFSFQCCGSDAKATLEKDAVEAMAL